MKRLVVGTLLLASAGLATALTAQSPDRPRALFPGATVSVAFQFDRGERAADGTTTARNVTITIGDVVITADDAILDKTEIKLGTNARVTLPSK